MYKRHFTVIWVLTLVLTLGVTAQTAFRLGDDSTDYGKDIAIDKTGNVIVAGYFFGTVDFDPGIGVNNLISTGNIDNFIAKYKFDGKYLWAIKFGGTGEDASSSVKTDDSGNIYVCGYFSGQADFDPGPNSVVQTSNGLKDAYVVKYDSNGSFIWVNTFGADSNDVASDIHIDKNGNVLVTGSFQGIMDIDPGTGIVDLTSNGKKDIFLLKYTLDGNFIGGFSVGGAGDDEGMAVITDSLGDYYLSGYFNQTVDFDPGQAINNFSSNGGSDIFLCKYSSNDIYQWGKTIGGKGYDAQSPRCLYIDVAQTVYIAGDFSHTISFDVGEATLTSHGYTDVFLAKYFVDGTFQRCFGVGGTEQDRCYSVSVDWDGSIYLAGSFKGTADLDPGSGEYLLNGNGTNGASDIFTAKFNSIGNILWANGVGAATSNPNDLSLAASLALDGLSNCYATGKFYRTADFDPSSGLMNFVSAGSSDIFIIKMNGDGTLWTQLNAPITNISPKSLNIGYVFIDSMKQTTFSVYNIGDIDLVISSAYSTNPKFSVSPISATISPLEALEYTVTFAPTDSGHQTSWIILDHNGNNDKDSVFVSGWGVGYLDHSILQLSAGWNMISIPLIVGSGSKTFWFPTAISDAFAYSATGYLSADTLMPGTGYWLKYDSSQTIIISGQARNEDTLDVMIGWNLIGSLTYPVSTSSIIQIPPDIIMSSFYDFSGSYGIASILLPGRGYWVKVNQAGKLVLSAP
jgi:hypothetical protein